MRNRSRLIYRLCIGLLSLMVVKLACAESPMHQQADRQIDLTHRWFEIDELESRWIGAAEEKGESMLMRLPPPNAIRLAEEAFQKEMGKKRATIYHRDFSFLSSSWSGLGEVYQIKIFYRIHSESPMRRKVNAVVSYLIRSDEKILRQKEYWIRADAQPSKKDPPNKSRKAMP